MKVSPSAVVNAIPNSRIESLVDQIISPLRTAMIKIVCAFVISPSPKTMLTLERSLFAAFLETGRNLLEMLLNSLENSPDQPVVIKHGKNNFFQKCLTIDASRPLSWETLQRPLNLVPFVVILSQTIWESIVPEKSTIAKHLFEQGIFTEASSIVYADSEFCCTYCESCILDSRDSWMGAAEDHILPQSVYPNLQFAQSNLAVACKACNDLKGAWDPATPEENKLFKKSDKIEAKMRKELIRRVQKYLKPRWRGTDETIDKVKKILDVCKQDD